MPIQSCQKDNKPGYQYGEEGHCYTYNPKSKTSKQAALTKAKKQGTAIEISKHSASSEEFQELIQDLPTQEKLILTLQYERL